MKRTYSLTGLIHSRNVGFWTQIQCTHSRTFIRRRVPRPTIRWSKSSEPPTTTTVNSVSFASCQWAILSHQLKSSILVRREVLRAMQGAEGRPSAKPSPVGAAETASDPLEPMVGGDRPFPSNFPTTHSRAYLGCLTKAESILQTKQASMRHAFQFRHLSYADKIMKTSGAARRSMIFSRDKTQALKCIDVAEDVQAAERAMLALHVEDVPPPSDVQELPDEEDDDATPLVLQPAGRSRPPSPSRRQTRNSGPDPLLELLLTLTLEPFFDRNIFILRNPETARLFNDDRGFLMELQRLYRSLRDGTVRNHARIHPRTCTQRDTQTHARARAHTHAGAATFRLELSN